MNASLKWKAIAAGALAVITILTLQANGMCITNGRFYTDDEFRQMTIDKILVGRYGATTACESPSKESGTGSCGRYSEMKVGIPSLKNYIDQNPNCCKVHDGYEDQYGVRANAEFYHYILGLRYKFFDASWPQTTIYVATGEQTVNQLSLSFALDHCGGMRSVQSILESSPY